MTLSAIPSGLYDLLITERLERLLAADESARHRAQPLTEDAAEIIADTLVRQLGALLDDLPGEGAEAAQRQLALVNEMLVWLRQRVQTTAHKSSAEANIDLLSPPARLLRAVHRTPASPTPPELGLAAPWLFTAGKGSPSLLQEIRRELASSDRVDILVSFITVSGLRKLQDVLPQSIAQGPVAASQRLRPFTDGGRIPVECDQADARFGGGRPHERQQCQGQLTSTLRRRGLAASDRSRQAR